MDEVRRPPTTLPSTMRGGAGAVTAAPPRTRQTSHFHLYRLRSMPMFSHSRVVGDASKRLSGLEGNLKTGALVVRVTRCLDI